MKKKIGIILVNYKNYADKYLAACRDSLRQQNYGQDNLQVYIIDNASSHNSREVLKSIYPEAEIIPRPNGNYSAANNLGFKRAILDGCFYLLTLNIDTEIEENCLSELVVALEKNPTAGISQAKILLYSQDKEKRINTLGNSLHFLGFGTTSCYQELDRKITGYPEIKGYASGCCFIFRKQLFVETDGYNEEYFMYHDDVEFGVKTRLRGKKIILAPQAIVYHKYEFSRSTKMLYFMERNRYLFIFSFYPLSLILLISPILLCLNLGLFFFALIKGWLKIWGRVNLYFLNPRNWWKIFIFRRKIKKLKKIPFTQISQDFKGKLEFLEIDNFILRFIVNPIFNLYWQFIKKII